MSIQFTGLGSGLDYASWVEQLVAAKKASLVTPLESKKTDLENQSSALDTIKNSYTELQKALKNFTSVISNTSNDIWSKTNVTSSNDAFVTATSSNGLAVGSINISVQQLATSTVAKSAQNPAKLISDDTKFSEIGNNQAKGGTFSFYVDNKRYEVEIDANNDTLADISQKISDASNGEATAKVNPDGTFEINATSGGNISVRGYS